jgi:fructose-bisphosphate aldolase, class II
MKNIVSLYYVISFDLQPRECLRSAEVNTVARLGKCFEDLKCQNILGLGGAREASNVLGPRRGGLPV